MGVIDYSIRRRVAALEAGGGGGGGVDLSPLTARVAALEAAGGVDLTPLTNRVTALEAAPAATSIAIGEYTAPAGNFFADSNGSGTKHIVWTARNQIAGPANTFAAPNGSGDIVFPAAFYLLELEIRFGSGQRTVYPPVGFYRAYLHTTNHDVAEELAPRVALTDALNGATPVGLSGASNKRPLKLSAAQALTTEPHVLTLEAGFFGGTERIDYYGTREDDSQDLSLRVVKLT